jgi:hypothetical protein
MTAFILKIIAILTMTIDHSSLFLYNSVRLTWLRIVGRIAFPIFAFQISEGYVHTKNLKRYFLRLILFALISQIPYYFFSNMFMGALCFNIIFSLILGLLAITIFDFFHKKGENLSKSKKLNYDLTGLVFVFIIAIITYKLNLDYGYYGILLMFIFFIFRNKKIFMNLFSIAITILYYIPFWLSTFYSGNISYISNITYAFLFSLIPLFFINLYNGKQGIKCKWLFYIYYPIHISIICLLQYFLR